MKKNKKAKKNIVILLVLLVIVFLAFGVYYYLTINKKDDKTKDIVKETSTITVNYYVLDTTTKILDSDTLFIQQGDEYATKAKSPIITDDGTTYIIRETSGNTTGVADTDKIEVNYYYAKKG